MDAAKSPLGEKDRHMQARLEPFLMLLLLMMMIDIMGIAQGLYTTTK